MAEKWIQRIKERLFLFTAAVCLIPLIFAVAASTAGSATTAPKAPETTITAMDRQVLEEVVNMALERQLAPIKEMLTELTIRQPTLPDILGGLGYILGLFGLWAYFLSKRKKDS